MQRYSISALMLFIACVASITVQAQTISITSENLCAGQPISFELTGTTQADSVSWDYGNGITTDLLEGLTNTYTYTDGGMYTITAAPNNGEILVTTDITVEGMPSIGADSTFFCSNSPFVVELEPNDDYTYTIVGLDRDPDNPNNFIGTIGGSYTVEMKGANCTFMMGIQVEEAVEQVLFPNVFTPNGDMLNDQFFPVFNKGCRFEMLDIQVYSRWGNLVYEYSLNTTTAINKEMIQMIAWNGDFENEALPSDVYSVRVAYKLLDQQAAMHVGEITLVR